MNKPDLVHKWQTEEVDLSDGSSWTILVQAVRLNGEEILGLGWVPMDEPDEPTATVCFHQRDAATALQTLYSAFSALEDPESYMKQIGMGSAASARPPSSGIVGSVEGQGSLQVHVDWSTPKRYSTFMVYPPDGGRIHVNLGIESVAHLAQLTIEVFKSLDWAIPE